MDFVFFIINLYYYDLSFSESIFYRVNYLISTTGLYLNHSLLFITGLKTAII